MTGAAYSPIKSRNHPHVSTKSRFLERRYGVSMKLNEENEPFFITEDMAAEMAAAGYEFKPPGHARTKSVRDLYGWQSGETLEQAIAGQQRRQCLSS